jgi:methionyl-tRNA formyltransferase
VPVRAVVFAYHDVGTRCLDVLVEQGVAVPLVVTHRDAPGERIWFASVAARAAGYGLETVMPEAPDSPALAARIRAAAPDLLFSFYYRHMLPPELLAIPPRGAFNMHGSLLPKYRGRAPINWAILHGERETGATLHEMTEKADAGRIVDQAAVPIAADDCAVDVFRRVTDAAALVLRRSLPRLVDGSAVLRPQDLASGSYFGGRRPEDGRIDWRQSAARIHDLVRAVAPPFPGAFTDLPAGRLSIHRTRRLQPTPGAAAAPGLSAALDAPHVRADCADGESLELLELALDGAPLSAEAFRARFGGEPVSFPLN